MLPPSFNATISSQMSAAEIVGHLQDHGCQDITGQLDTDSCSTQPLSDGGFGDVYGGRLLNGTLVAIKTLRLLVDDSNKGHKALKHAAHELYVWSKCQHPNVLPLTGLVIFRDQVGMVSTWARHGSLSSYAKVRRGRCEAVKISVGIARGLAYLHDNNIVHGDLKGHNVLISNTGRPMLTDFGNAVIRYRTLRFTPTARKQHLSLRWAAPELLDDREGTYSREADVYALGMTILEAYTGKVPYFGKSDLRIMALVILLKAPPERPEAIGLREYSPRHYDRLWELLSGCWANEPTNRPTAHDVAHNLAQVLRPLRRAHATGQFERQQESQRASSNPRTESPEVSHQRPHVDANPPTPMSEQVKAPTRLRHDPVERHNEVDDLSWLVRTFGYVLCEPEDARVSEEGIEPRIQLTTTGRPGSRKITAIRMTGGCRAARLQRPLCCQSCLSCFDNVVYCRQVLGLSREAHGD